MTTPSTTTGRHRAVPRRHPALLAVAPIMSRAAELFRTVAALSRRSYEPTAGILAWIVLASLIPPAAELFTWIARPLAGLVLALAAIVVIDAVTQR
ncbi:hypothetical protein NDR87_31665 [Nocardia sp. CDC159]|uniref:Uncharacterized protein n=1 Tax=Nocardia pulmonis TaxID=2951408 RepID=A0A9X2IZB4_9NOCA|nr:MULTISPECIES: hypothetical protein [Nocardia]MCM6777892.1 hypothetical protein [Nocardia pulmonis]MCM6790937.1 hypothetical protein [Nocardia sp. CDC159]